MYEINNPNNRLNVLELHRKINQRNEKKSICYEKVLEICNKRILSQTERDKTNCVFEFPEYIIGYPLFDLNMCIKYCEKHLVANGFLVKYMFPNKFYISWDFDEIKKHKDEERKKLPLVAVLPKQNTSQNIPQNTSQNIIQNPTSNPAHIQHSLQPSSNQQTITYNQNNIPLSTVSNIQATQLTQPVKPITFSSQPLQQQTLPQIDPQIHAKMTQPLPKTLPKYNPFDLYPPSIHDKPVDNDDGPKKSAIDNSFFANSFKQSLTSGIGATKMFEYKPSGKLALNL